jgi:hypothetical protein
MDIELLHAGAVTIVEGKSPLSTVNDALDLIAACSEHNTDYVLLDTPVLPDAFFELQTRFAGELLQKLQNYRLRTAVVVSPVQDYGERFTEYLREARKAQYSRLFTSRDEAIAWLVQA